MNNLVEFVCLTGIPFRSTVGTQERYFATLADAQADATANGGVADEVSCPTPVPTMSGPSLAVLALVLLLGISALSWRRRPA